MVPLAFRILRHAIPDIAGRTEAGVAYRDVQGMGRLSWGASGKQKAETLLQGHAIR